MTTWAAVVCAALLTGCQNGATLKAEPTGTPTGAAARCAAPMLPRYLIGVVSTGGIDGLLRRVDLCTLTSTAFSRLTAVTAVSANPERVVAAAGLTGPDRLYEVAATGSWAAATPGPARGSLPALQPAGEALAFLDPDANAGKGALALQKQKGSPAELIFAPPRTVAGVSWAGTQRIACLEQLSDTRTGVAVVDTSGRVQASTAVEFASSNVVASASWIAVSPYENNDAPGRLFDARLRTSLAIPSGWYPKAWTVDGSYLLLRRGREISFMPAPSPAAKGEQVVTPIGSLREGSLLAAGWPKD